MPIPQPTRRPIAPPIPADIGPTPKPGGCPVPPEWSLCLVRPAEERLYSCFPLEEVLPQTCPTLGITFEVTRCDGLAVTRRRQLKKKGSKSDSAEDDAEEEEEEEETTIFARGGTTNSTLSTSAATTSLRLPDCTRACVIVDDEICFHGVHGNHFVSFFAIDRHGERVGNLNRRRVAGYSRDFGGCRSANVQCRES